jgi:hypothetical protein
MRYMIIVKANKDSEAGVMPSDELVEGMGKFNEQLMSAGVLVAAEGLQASSKGAKVRFENGKFTVTDGPFAEAKELVAGFWIVDVRSKDEVIEWVKRIPFEEGEEIEVRKVFEASDWEEAGGDPAVFEQEKVWREKLGGK